MSMSNWLELLLLGAVAGAVGQLVRAIAGFAKASRETAANPETQSLNVGQNQFLGISRGAGASDLGTSAFAPGFTGTGPATAMLYDFYNAATTFGGRCPSLGLGLNRLVFVPLATGGYQWTGS